jgi:serine protease AprX
MQRLFRSLLLCAILGAVLAVVARGQGVAGSPGSAKVDPLIFEGKERGESAAFLVVLRDQADLSAAAAIRDRAARRTYVYEKLRAHAAATQARLRERLGAAGVRFRSHYLVDMIEVEGTKALATDLAAMADTRAIERNSPASLEPRISAKKTERSAAGGIEANVQKVRAPELWARGFTGQGIVIGVADTGFEWNHPALKRSYRGWDGSSVTHDYNWHDAIHDAAPNNPCGSDSPAPCDDYGHGTGVAGLAVGDDGLGNRIGVAPGARLIGCRNMAGGAGTPARYTECFEWFLAPTDSNGANPRPDLGADVINNSWSCPQSEGCTDPEILRAVVENVRAAGIPVVAAAGNYGISCGSIVDAPAIFDASFTIGAVDINDQMTGFSSIGPVTIDGSNRLKPDLCAPGQSTRTAAPGGSYRSEFTGTSAAAPHVAGGIALLWSAVPTLAGDVDETEAALEESALPLTGLLPYTPEEIDRFCGGHDGLVIPNLIFGWGRLDVERAYELAAPTPPVPSPCVADSTTRCLDGGRFIEFPLAALSGGPGDIAAGSDGALWFVDRRNNSIGRVKAGDLTEFPIAMPGTGAGPVAIAAGSDGNLWFTETVGQIGRITTSGLITEFPLPTAVAFPQAIVAGPDGNLWLTAFDRDDYGLIARVTTAGVATTFAAADSNPADIAAGPDGNLWFTDGTGSVRRMTTEGVLTGSFPLPTAGSRPTSIAAGPDGNLWFTERTEQGVGRITPSGIITMFPIPSGNSPWGIAAGPDGNLWFTDSANNRIGRITTAGAVTEFSFPTTGSLFYPASIAAGSDGNLWVTDWSGKAIGRIALKASRRQPSRAMPRPPQPPCSGSAGTRCGPRGPGRAGPGVDSPPVGLQEE